MGKLIFSPNTSDLKEFDKLVKEAKTAGVTHILISPLLDRTDFQGLDIDSPWCEWAKGDTSIFKHVLPEELKDAFPKEFIKKQMDFLKKRHAIVAKYKLKAAYYGNEPHWLNEKVYEKHPTWRGARCDNSLRSVGLFFSPCVDNPEVLELYRKAVAKLLKEAPLIDTLCFKTNDAGSGICWSGQLYTNENGASNCRFRNMGKRVVGFLSAVQQGASDSGIEAEVFISTWFPQAELESIIANLKPRMGIITGHGSMPGDTSVPLVIRNIPPWTQRTYQPNDYSNPCSIAESLFNVRNLKNDHFMLVGKEKELNALKIFSKFEGVGTEKDKILLLEKFAESLYGKEVVNEVVDAWYKISKADTLSSVANMTRYMMGLLALRWINRPLVAHQERLTEDEKAYWLPNIYQSKGSQPSVYMDYMSFTGESEVKTWDHATVIAIAIDSISGIYANAAYLFEKASNKVKDEKIKQDLLTEMLQLKVRKCMTLTIRHTLQVATLSYERDRWNALHPKTSEVDPEVPGNPRGTPAFWFMYRSLRWELDNTNELISILKGSKVPLINTAKTKEEQHVFLVGPDILEELQMKVKIMLKHWRDAEDGYYRPTLGG
ncbi:MAG: hypothetical protein A2452_00260 [Candidatus Firestonebacteria bacterium RIFOXYC2_FULL_39_67]|nr:MAG: hypothetical protein A2536_05965 [Candidatus Firestonebacteria bacterium RIFOXYD2_FULL_39_29]OGF54236.1 MAG: hypothetical protein A2452_00260 [Candidatus Firestonebacteria bacterium RIFOXYC2_FULL_39_67]